MSCQTLGGTFDIHRRRCRPAVSHHENVKIAQSEGVTGKTMARFWMHNGSCAGQRKMSKSLGNFFTIREVLAKYDPQTVRFSWCAPITHCAGYSAMFHLTMPARPCAACTRRWIWLRQRRCRRASIGCKPYAARFRRPWTRTLAHLKPWRSCLIWPTKPTAASHPSYRAF